MTDLTRALFEAGLVQFGRFERAEENIHPFRLYLEMLPAYPALLRACADASVTLLEGQQIERLLCDDDSLPLGVCISQQTGIPLVYSRGRGEAAISDLVGAYDVGHPTTLILNTADNPEKIARHIQNAGRVGLEVRMMIILCAMTEMTSQITVPAYAVLQLHEIVRHLMEQGDLPMAQGQAVIDWLTLRRDSAAP